MKDKYRVLKNVTHYKETSLNIESNVTSGMGL